MSFFSFFFFFADWLRFYGLFIILLVDSGPAENTMEKMFEIILEAEEGFLVSPRTGLCQSGVPRVSAMTNTSVRQETQKYWSHELQPTWRTTREVLTVGMETGLWLFCFKNPPVRRVTWYISMEQSKPRAHSSQNLVATRVCDDLSFLLAWRGVTVTDAWAHVDTVKM